MNRARAREISPPVAPKPRASYPRLLPSTHLEPRAHVTVAVSVSESPDLPELGLFDTHLRDAVEVVASELLAYGHNLAYGGDLRSGGFTELLLQLLDRYRGYPDHDGVVQVSDYLAWPVHIQMPNNEIQACMEAHDRVASLVLLTPSGTPMSWNERKYLPPHQPSDEEWQQGLTAMRRVMLDESDARLVLGGRVERYQGKMPGVAEEALLTMRYRKPLYLLGGFGGCAHDIAVRLGLIDGRVRRSQDWNGASEFDAFCPSALGNGLNLDENRALAKLRAIREAMVLVRRGLRRLHGSQAPIV